MVGLPEYLVRAKRISQSVIQEVNVENVVFLSIPRLSRDSVRLLCSNLEGHV